MENRIKRNLIVKIIILSAVLVSLVCLFSYTVYASITQTLSIGAQIIITDDGQAKSVINIYETLGPNDNTTFLELNQEPNFELAFTKQRDEDSAFGNFNIKPTFGGKNEYRYYIMKIEIQNVSTIPLSYRARVINELGEDFVFSSQLQLLYMQNQGNPFSLVDISNIEGIVDVQQKIERYIVLTIKDGVDFVDLVPTSTHSFYLNIEVNANEN